MPDRRYHAKMDGADSLAVRIKQEKDVERILGFFHVADGVNSINVHQSLETGQIIINIVFNLDEFPEEDEQTLISSIEDQLDNFGASYQGNTFDSGESSSI